ncbi:YggS family pyridoxal phosphate-dependent enzyme [Rhodocytophaga rosea]|uniref:Pyridoxal phosphate homeostasis protein n=1 Tax=Rhodocytophaga rosea TaxID=2704465 RepID=A0A6C0GJZ8_9BACT|nr:YggS family pyridoxal phosphate-dependent enzyme [Rhodocytophaga rosea]QHT67960.1 YggS family pyridoxal phosphate-dependent enzyme [Rhodocytophaga rosea]
MISIQENIRSFDTLLQDTSCKLIAVTKTKPIEMLMQAYEAGSKRFGENKVQEMVEKYEQLPKDIEWHLIGHLQSNKVKYIAPFVSMIHSIDSLKLLQEVDKQAKKYNKIIPCLLQIHIAEEETKFGLSYQEAEELLQSSGLSVLKNITIAGLMGMATFTDNQEHIRQEFRGLKLFFEQMKRKTLPAQVKLTELSIGMSGDYQIAIEEGSTLIRVGSSIFGAR